MRAKSVKRSNSQVNRAALFTVEKLEERQMLSVFINSWGRVKATIPAGENGSITVSYTSPSVLEVTVDGVPYDFNPAYVSKLNLIGSDGNDTIRVEEGKGAVTIPTFIYGGTGNSTLVGGSGVDTIAGGNGSNLVYTAANGTTSIYFGSGNNFINANTHDNVVVGSGANVINKLTAGVTISAGSNTIINKAGAAMAGAGVPVAPANGGFPGNNTVPSGFDPTQYQFAYNFPGASANDQGLGQTIVLVVAYDDPYLQQELAAFDSQFNLPAANVQVFYPTGVEPIVDPTRAWSSTEAPTVEMMHAVSPSAKIDVVETTNNARALLLGGVVYGAGLIAGTGGVLYMGWQDQEDVPNPMPPPPDIYPGIIGTQEANYDSVFNAAQFNNVSFVAGSGINLAGALGTAPGLVNFPASASNVTSVGTTTLTLNANSFRTNETAYSNGDGGVSRFEPAPNYQYGLGFANRAGPDVALDGDPASGYALYSQITDPTGQYGWIEEGSSIYSGALFAGIATNINGLRNSTGQWVLGHTLNSLIYNAGYYDPSVYNDIFTGSQNNAVTMSMAAGGFDTTTGWGTPIVSSFESLLSGVYNLPANTNAGASGVNSTLQWSGQFDENWAAASLTGPSFSAFNGTGSLTGQNNLVLALTTTTEYQTNPANTPVVFLFNNLTFIGGTFSGTGTASGLSAPDLTATTLSIGIDGTVTTDAAGAQHVSGEFYTIDPITGVRLSLSNTQPIFFGSFHG